MTPLQILSKKDARIIEANPDFNGEERKKYFRLTTLVSSIPQRFFSPYAKVGFILHLGYFKATGRFYSSRQYQPADFRFVCKQLGFPATQVDMERYTKQMYVRHKTTILDLCGIVAFKERQEQYE